MLSTQSTLTLSSWKTRRRHVPVSMVGLFHTSTIPVSMVGTPPVKEIASPSSSSSSGAPRTPTKKSNDRAMFHSVTITGRFPLGESSSGDLKAISLNLLHLHLLMLQPLPMHLLLLLLLLL